MATKYWYPRTCSENLGCILETTNPTTLAGISKTCRGHAGDFGRSIGLPAFVGLPGHNDLIAGDSTVYDAIRTQNKAGTEESTVIPFKVYDEMRIGNVDGLGFSEILVIYESALTAPGDDASVDPPDPAFLASSFTSIKAANPGVTKVCLDQESWWSSTGGGAIPSNHIQFYLDLIDIAHDYWPDVGIYSGCPERYLNHLNFAVGTDTYNTRLANWQARCASTSQIFDAVNTLYPSIYYLNPVHNNATKRDLWYQQNYDICNTLAPGKPVLMFMTHEYHTSLAPTFVGDVPTAYWRASLDKVLSIGCDGAVIWKFSGDVDPRTTSPVEAWWPELLDFIADNAIEGDL